MAKLKKLGGGVVGTTLGLWLLSLGTTPCRGGELRELYRGARAQAMGNAFVAVADDEEAIFYNPAGLAGNRKYSIHYFDLSLESSGDLVNGLSGNVSAFNNLSGDSLNYFMGKNIYGRAQFSPSFVMPNFGLSVLMDGQAALLAKNVALPQITLGYQQTNGIQAAFGTSLKGKSRGKSDFRLGGAVKLLWRRGGYHYLPMDALMNANKNTLSQVTGNFQQGYGLDVGTQYLYSFNPKLMLSLGLAYTDIGDTIFGGLADPVKSNLSAGFAWTYQWTVAKAIFSYDYRHILDTTDWRKRNHLGAEFSVPMLSLYGGVSQVNLTYGFGFDAWIFKVMALSYVEELAGNANVDSERRYLLRIAYKIGF